MIGEEKEHKGENKKESGESIRRKEERRVETEREKLGQRKRYT